ncbi:uncharacterized protein LOC124712125 [Schistocerca piceifrons]|uniref:uncharacterized protein LOC124712125 n=1 Tax=Schistocerca piceifrons TaxID=274613 RepID=UPI001F5ECCFA|nr:uncharacterized protein LOC124712125 [Schistocerca piceifrons]
MAKILDSQPGKFGNFCTIHQIVDEMNAEMHQQQKQHYFEEWKISYEKVNHVRYVMNCSEQERLEKRVRYYHCHRSFNFNSKGTGARCVKSMGMNKIGSTCPSNMQVTITEDKCCLKFFQNIWDTPKMLEEHFCMGTRGQSWQDGCHRVFLLDESYKMSEVHQSLQCGENPSP